MNADTQDAVENGPTTVQDVVANAGEVDRTDNNAPRTTTISTIAVQSGKTRLVIALLQSGDWIQLKILEVQPELTALGETLEEALELQKAHDEVLLQLQSKQSPVEELLRQADQLISTQRPRAEVYAAMAESLGRAWRDVNKHLEHRKQVLDLNVLYKDRERQFHDRCDILDETCKDTVVPFDVEAVKATLTNIHEIRRSVLEALMTALQAGNQLLAKLQELCAEGSLDSRPERIRQSVNKAISQVERWLNNLHIRRQVLELSWNARKKQLEQCLALSLLAKDLKELEMTVADKRDQLKHTNELGDSSSSTDLLLHEHRKLMSEARQFQERALKLTKATEQLAANECFAGEEATAQSYAVLASTSDYMSELENRELLLERTIAFFKQATEAFSQLDDLESQLSSTNLPSMSSQLVALHAECSKKIEEITFPAIQEGHSLLDAAGRGSASTDGVKQTVAELENRKVALNALCTAHREENLRIVRALSIFLESQRELYSWLVEIAERFLLDHPHMGDDLPTAKEFLELHNRLLNDLQTKGNEINNLLLTLPPILEYLDDAQRHDVDMKVESLHHKWLELKNALENRLDLGAVYVRFHTEANTVSNEMDKLEDSLRTCPDNQKDALLDSLEERWSSLLPLYQQAKNTGLNFISQSSQAVEPRLDVGRARRCVESTLERLSARQLVVTRSWQSFRTDVVEKRELLVQWQTIMTESTQTINWVTKLDAQLYPIITTPASNPKDIANDLESKLFAVLTEIRKARGEVESRIKTTETLEQKSPKHDVESRNIKNKLQELNNNLTKIITDYQILLEMMVSYFRNLADLEKTLDKVNREYSEHLPADLYDTESKSRDHDANKQAILEMFKFTQNDCEPIISRVIRQEPPSAADNDIKRLQYTLENSRNSWESNWNERKFALEQHLQLCQFNNDLHQINETLDDLSRQLANVKGQYGESLSSAKSTSAAFVYFEKTIELLEQKIAEFINTGKQLLAQEHGQSPHIEREIKRLKDRWADFKKQVEETRRLIDLAILYFQLVEEADEWFREGSKLLVIIARKSTSVKKPEEATELLNELETFLKPGEEKQSGRIKKIQSLAQELYGIDKSKVTQVVIENKEMLDSFTAISNELSTLARNLKLAEEEQARLKKEKEEAEARLAVAQAQAEAAAAEQARRAAEAAEEARRATAAAEEARKIAEAAEEARRIAAAEEARKIAAEEARKVALEEEARKAAAEEEARKASAEEARKAAAEEESRRAAAEQAKKIAEAEEARRATEATVRALEEEMVRREIIHKIEIEHIEAQPLSSTEEEVIVPEQKLLVVEEPEPKPPQFVVPLTDAVIQEGSKFTFECQVIGFPTPIVNWHKDGISIQNNPDYQTSFDRGLCTLTIEETFAEDSARYTCKAINGAGSTETAAILSVKETEPEEQLAPPVFVRILKPGTAKEGGAFKFECQVEGNPLPTVQWFKNHECIDNSPDFGITYNNGDAVLRFEETFLEDKAEYTCKATNELGTAQTTASLSVNPLEPTIGPEFVVPLSNVMARAGNKLKLECEVSGLPMPTITWTHNGKPVWESHDLQLQSEGGRASLVITEAFPKDAGTYVATAASLAGTATSACIVAVKGRLPNETSDSELASDIEPIRPSIQVSLQDTVVREGDRARLDCVIVGQPEPEVIWYRDGRPVKESNDFQLLFQGDRCTLVIQEALPEDAGEYRVVAINSAGEASSSCKLTVTLAEPAKPAAPAGSAPKFDRLLTDVLAAEGDRVILECSVGGDPVPDVRWLLNNQPVSDDGRVHLTRHEDGSARLDIEHVSADDRGVYTVKATNSAGEAKCFAQLIVKSARAAEPANAAPAFREPLADRVCFERQQARFECLVSGRPTPLVHWLFNGQPVPNEFVVSTEGERQVLIIPETTAHHQGGITCLAQNEVGEASSEAFLSVQPLSIITLPDMEPTEQRSESSYSVRREVFVQQSSSNKVISSSSSTGTEPQVQVHSMIQQNQQSFKQVGNEVPVVKEAHRLEEYHQVNKEPPLVSEKTVTKVTTGKDIKEGLSLIPRPLRKTIAPRFVSPVVGKIVDQGVDVVLEGIVDGYPTPEITWTKNGVPMESSDGVNITWELNHAKIVLKSVTVKDAGKYTCTAINEAGSAVSTTDLVVKKSVFPPVFGRRLQAQVVKKGDRLIMEVEVTGTPEPTITWHKDELPIEEVLKDEFRTKCQGNCHTLIVDKTTLNHTGKYMVRAINSGGEARSIADIAVFEPTPDTMVEVVKTVVYEDVQKQEIVKPAEKKTSEPTPIPVTVEIPVTILPERKFISPVNLIDSSPNQFATMTQSISESSSQSISQSISQNTTKFTLERTSSPFQEIQSIDPLKIETPSVLSEHTNRIVPIFVEEPQKKEEITPLLKEIQEPIIIPVKVSKYEPAMPPKPATPELILPPKSITPVPSPNVEISSVIPVLLSNEPDIVQTVEETGIETSSISKKTSLDFFVTKIKESDKLPEPKLIETQKIAPDIFHKFQEPKITEIQKQFEFHAPPEIQQDTRNLIEKFEYKPDVSEIINEQSKMYSSSVQEYKQFTSSQTQLFEEFNLTPEPPPEIGYIPKTEGIKKREDVSCRVKKLAEVHRDLSPLEVPIGGVRMFPTPPPQKVEKKEITVQKAEPAKIQEKFIPITKEQKEIVEEVCVRKQSYRRESIEYNMPIISPVETAYWAPVTFPSETVTLTEPPPVFRPQADIITRPLSPRPSAEGVRMEKLWSPHQPTTPEPIKSAEIIQTPSPRPFSQNNVTETQWSTSQKIEKTSFEKSNKSNTIVGPSQEGKNMEKMWAHKHSDSHVRKWWPPPQTEDQTPPPKNIQSYVHKSFPEEKQDIVSKKEETHSVKESVVQTSEYPTLEKQWTPFEKKEDTKLTHSFVQEPTVQNIHTTVENQWKPEVRQEFVKETSTIQRKDLVTEKKNLIEHWKHVEPAISSPVQHYISESRVSHSTNLNQQMSQISQSFEKSENVEFKSEYHSENVIEERHKASEIIKSWPPTPVPKEDVAPKVPSKVKETPKVDLHIRPISVQDITDEVYLEPGPPPEIGYAEAPRERRQSYVETIEQDLEKNLDKEPTRVLPGSVRTIPPPRDKSLSREKSQPREKPPPPLPPKKEPLPQAPPLPSKSVKPLPKKSPFETDNISFDRFPDLEPFPFKPSPAISKSPRPPPPATPSKFVKGKFGDSDYESDVEGAKIPPKWKPCQSDTEDFNFRKVKPPRLSPITRSRSTDPEPIPPTQFERPLSMQGPPRPQLDLESTKKELRREVTVQKLKETKRDFKQTQVISPPELKPGSPPQYICTEPPKVKPDSPKTKHKVYAESGYMADTDEPLTLQRKSIKSEHHRTEEMSRTEYKQSMSSDITHSSHRVIVENFHSPQTPVKTHHHRHEHRKHVSTSAASKKELVAPVVSITNHKVIQKEDRDSSLEPFPYKAELPRPKRSKGPPPPSPSKFVKGEWRESDYESDYDGRIPPVWKPSEADGDPAYKPVKPVLTPSGYHSRSEARTPTPPTEFDNPPQIEYPPRPKFEPIEKPKQTVKLNEILKAAAKPQVVFKPKPLPAKTQIIETIVATPAIKPGSPPELGFAPPRTTQYYRSTASQPYHNATQTETSNIVHFDESTDKSHRTVSVEHTTRIIKFGEKKNQQERTKIVSGPLPPTPKKFIPGEFRESDYESEVENAKIKPKWTPGYNENDDPRYRKVAPPASGGRSASVPIMRERVLTPMEFDTQPPVLNTNTTYSSRDVTDGSIKRISKRFGETQSTQFVKQAKTYQSNDVQLHPGSPPEYAFSPIKVPVKKAKEIASQHMEDMTHSFKSKTQKFVNDIMTDIKTPQKPILKHGTDTDGDAQAYREESRVAQYGTKHIDPDTGLIYFKYDFGYEFGVVLPGQSFNGEIPQPKKTIIQPPKRSGDIVMPVQHETTKSSINSTPKFKGGKNVKWEPTSESEMSEIEGSAWTAPMKGRGRGAETPPSTPSTPGSTHTGQHHVNSDLPKKAPLFITPLREIAVMSGQTARFECIVQSEPTPSILWSKNGRIIENSHDYQIQYRNGVCRLTIPQAFPEDAGTFVCTATNLVGAANTTATLQVPGERRSSYLK